MLSKVKIRLPDLMVRTHSFCKICLC